MLKSKFSNTKKEIAQGTLLTDRQWDVPLVTMELPDMRQALKGAHPFHVPTIVQLL